MYHPKEDGPANDLQAYFNFCVFETNKSSPLLAYFPYFPYFHSGTFIAQCSSSRRPLELWLMKRSNHIDLHSDEKFLLWLEFRHQNFRSLVRYPYAYPNQDINFQMKVISLKTKNNFAQIKFAAYLLSRQNTDTRSKRCVGIHIIALIVFICIISIELKPLEKSQQFFTIFLGWLKVISWVYLRVGEPRGQSPLKSEKPFPLEKFSFWRVRNFIFGDWTPW